MLEQIKSGRMKGNESDNCDFRDEFMISRMKLSEIWSFKKSCCHQVSKSLVR